MKLAVVAATACMTMALGSCDNMANQPKRKGFALSYGSQENWPISPPLHTIARDQTIIASTPPALTKSLLQRGRQRFNIYCSPCHGEDGEGDGVIVQRGFPHPPSYFSPVLLKANNQLFFDVMTHGYGVMYSYADRLSPADRWAVVAYIRALQASENGALADVPVDRRGELQ